ncbi:MAG: PLP-dependent aminotransferase family protein [Proteobacteria bacterium]|nr:PLP-dependent aminotransferase family protein [Pseudomonadota bacterium]
MRLTRVNSGLLDHFNQPGGQNIPLQKRVYDTIARAILTRSVGTGERLPSSRELAKILGIGRNTVITAFEQLHAEGFIETRHGSGTYVSARLNGNSKNYFGAAREDGSRAVRLAARASRYASVAASLRSPQKLTAFRINMPALDEFPISLWNRLGKSLLTGRGPESVGLLGEAEPAGYTPLREAIVSYLSIHRGVVCEPDQVVIVAGAQQGLDLSIRLLIDPGDVVWCEDPGFPGSVAALRAGGAEIGAVPVDKEGMDVEAAKRMFPSARLAVICPSSQFPLGYTMSLNRRLAILEWARRNDSWIVEDDYDSEFRYSGRPVRSLQGMDGGNRVVYIGTFSKVLFPGLRLAYLVVPRSVVTLFVNARIVAGRQSPTFEQALVQRFMTSGHLARHIARMRRIYSRRQQVLAEALRATIPGNHLQPSPGDTGLQLVAYLPRNTDDVAISLAAKQADLEVTPLSRMTLRRKIQPALLLGFGSFSDRQIWAGSKRLARVLSEQLG